MKHTITARITIPPSIFLEHGGFSFLQRQIEFVAEDLAEEHGYTSIEYVDHKLAEGSLDTSESESMTFVVTYEVG